MQFNQIPLPEVYKESQDFRFFIEWFSQALTKQKFDIENMIDIYDPLRCPENILWMLADTMGFKYDDRLPASYNRLVLLYFMSMIKLKGSKDGVTLAAEVNLAQFNIRMVASTGYEDEQGNFVEPQDILNNRLEDTSIPVNSVYVTPHTKEGYIDIVYFSTELPTDACIEYVRPLGMYAFQTPGVRFDARTKVSVDARLTDSNYIGISLGPTHVGHYRRADYARMQHMRNEEEQLVNTQDTRKPVYYRNKKYEKTPDPNINPGYRALYSLQLSNNENIVKSLIDPFFNIGYGPQDVSVTYPDNYMKDQPLTDQPLWNLQYDKRGEEALGSDVYTVEPDRTENILNPRPAVNPVMTKVGDSVSLATDNSKYSMNENGVEVVKDAQDIKKE